MLLWGSGEGPQGEAFSFFSPGCNQVPQPLSMPLKTLLTNDERRNCTVNIRPNWYHVAINDTSIFFCFVFKSYHWHFIHVWNSPLCLQYDYYQNYESVSATLLHASNRIVLRGCWIHHLHVVAARQEIFLFVFCYIIYIIFTADFYMICFH